MRSAAILLAAGRGERLGGDVPKCFVELEGRPLLAHAVDAATACAAVELVVVVAPQGFGGRAGPHVAHLGEGAVVIAGGSTRQESVAAGLAKIDESSFDSILVHDVARPLATTALFDAVLLGLADADGVVPAVPVSDTIKRVRGGVVAETLPREALVAVQTPQAFRSEALRRAHADADRERIQATDDAALLERIGCWVAVVPGDPRNIKVTRQEDLAVASLLARSG
ncbi:MAG: 2-C-methyl-D-erythritol 4-phosphate cytidylyltransferase [Actinomycetota bacterium]|nr:2-C-methyl-D-erythritol 4-phosphate cytidylyltransferase [Actinomycetota bacterium]